MHESLSESSRDPDRDIFLSCIMPASCVARTPETDAAPLFNVRRRSRRHGDARALWTQDISQHNNNTHITKLLDNTHHNTINIHPRGPAPPPARSLISDPK